MRKGLIKVMGITFILTLVLSAIVFERPQTELPPLLGTNTITQTYIS